ncbi:hypothetical protein BLL42_01410 [Pseudomonas frederiksbergensis]|uniref:Teneurin-like YD-shell domain-containing protein n=1 Tax=Pseudomonas frederiksbergensis TaxID=104087 RepID=A0A1J0EEY6_9PSED|nr:RHS repeat-associated core domain-containing protein [Pseudomonas frederiksbergensis]APC14456.1 hypothetical protein BLL42_01410 [Pseudomonas frederiksbergensis]
MGKTVTSNNLFDKPDSVRRIDLSGQQISEHVYQYDGAGRTAEEYDAAGNWTRYEYDGFDRMTKTVLPDSNEVERQYAGHSSEDLPVKISVNGVALGEQGFDGLDRMTVSITGGRKSVYTFDPGQSQPKSVKRPSGVETGYVYRPELGEDPEQRIALESTAIFTYDAQNARLKTTEEVDPSGIKHSLAREYFSTGELKSERREQTGEVTRVMYYEYSRQARLMRYTDVLGQSQEYEYNARAQLIATRLGDTRSTFIYDDLAQLKTIETVDGAQRLKIDLEYDDFGREVLRTFDLGNQITQTLSQTYDEVDRLTQRTLMQGSGTLRDETYAYDERGRLVDYNCRGSQLPEDPYGKVIKGQLFGFDAQDNLDFVETTFDGGRHSIYFEYTNADDPCQLTALTNQLSPALPGDPLYPPRIDFTYDADGNLLRDEVGRILGYDSLGRLISVSAQAGETATDYHYDSLDTLSGLGTSGGNEQRFYQGGELANQIKGANNSTFVRADGIVLAELQAGAGPKSLLLASDDKNSVLCELSQDGRSEVVYSAYGHRGADPAVSGHLGYNGERREAQTGWYLLGNGYRAFNPLLMRFHGPDSWSPFGVGGLNAYMYCLGNPVRFKDETGHSVFSRLAMLFMYAGGDDVVGAVASRVGSNAAKTAGRGSRQLVNVTDELGKLSVSTRPSRPTVRQPSARARSITPDYSRSPERAPQTLAREARLDRYVAPNSSQETFDMAFKQAKVKNPAIEMPVTNTSTKQKVSTQISDKKSPRPKQPAPITEQQKQKEAWEKKNRIEEIRKNDSRF